MAYYFLENFEKYFLEMTYYFLENFEKYFLETLVQIESNSRFIHKHPGPALDVKRYCDIMR